MPGSGWHTVDIPPAREALLAHNGVYAEMQRVQVPEGAKIAAAEPAA